MPQPGLRWHLVTINTFGTWLHGSPRGFRSRRHRIHSAGDYRSPPPPGEHAGLFRYRKERSRPPVTLTHALKPIVAIALRRWLIDAGYRVLAVSVCFDHAHLLVELPEGRRQIRAVIGSAKKFASRAIRHELPGTVWSAGCDSRPKDRKWSVAGSVRYIRDRQGAGSWTWCFRDAEGAYR